MLRRIFQTDRKLRKQIRLQTVAIKREIEVGRSTAGTRFFLFFILFICFTGVRERIVMYSQNHLFHGFRNVEVHHRDRGSTRKKAGMVVESYDLAVFRTAITGNRPKFRQTREKYR